MLGGEGNFTILEAVKRLFQPFVHHFLYEMDRFPIKKLGINHIDIHNSGTCSLKASLSNSCGPVVCVSE